MPELLRRVLQRRKQSSAGVPSVIDSLDDDEREILRRCRPYTMTTAERIIATMDAVQYAVSRPVSGAFAECGVWRGGSVLAMILMLQRHGVDDRDIYVYDTFEGMTEPTEEDTSSFHPPALRTFRNARARGQRAYEALFGTEVFGREQVEKLLAETGYPADRIHIVEGPVEETIPEHAPAALAVLRLDTDWYVSTKHEMEHLYPRVVAGGVLIVDDYGYWEGAKQAVDEYFAAAPPRPLFARTDLTGRLAIKQ